MDVEKLRSLGMYDFVKTLSIKHARWFNFDHRSSTAVPIEMMKDHKVFHYKHSENVPDIFHKPVVDVIFTSLPQQNPFNFEKERSQILEWFRNNLQENGFHFRPFSFKKGDKLVGMVLRIFADEDFPCRMHPEYITHTEGRAPCPVCKTAVTFGQFHPLEIKPVDSRLIEIPT